MIKVLIFGDIYGSTGRELLITYLPELKKKYNPDFVIANSENMTHGVGASPAHLKEIHALGVDIFTGGNHTFAHFESIAPLLDDPEGIQLRPDNYYSSRHFPLPGTGVRTFTKNGKQLRVINLISGNFLKDQVYNPFLRIDEILSSDENNSPIPTLIDFHRESTAETACMANWVDGRISLIYGTHTHVQTNDDRILPLGSGAITDIGMTGALHSSIGQDFGAWIPQFVSGTSFFSEKKKTATGDGVVCGLYAEIEPNRTIRLEKIRVQHTV